MNSFVFKAVCLRTERLTSLGTADGNSRSEQILRLRRFRLWIETAMNLVEQKCHEEMFIKLAPTKFQTEVRLLMPRGFDRSGPFNRQQKWERADMASRNCPPFSSMFLKTCQAAPGSGMLITSDDKTSPI